MWTPYLRSFCHCTATVLLGSSKGMTVSKASTSASVSTAGSKRKAPKPMPKVRRITKERVISLVKDVDIEEHRSDIVLQVEAELFLGNTD